MNFKLLKHFILYGVFGVLTTVINILVYWLLTRLLGLSVMPSTVIAWVAAVLFAYVTNKRYVFISHARSVKEIISEAANFFICRLATGFADLAVMYIFADLLGFNDVIIKTLSNILVIVLNYIASKLFIFR